MTAEVSGPITGGAHGWPFSLPLTDLDAVGYVAEEFFLDGTATAFEAEPGTELGLDGKWRVQPSRTAPFRTRMLVVRPADAARFNGIAHVNWQNVTAGFEIGMAADQLFDGYAWIGVSAQRVAVHGMPGTEQFALRGWDRERYGTLEHPGDDFSFDIYTQATRAITPSTLGGLEPEKLVATGASQSAMRMRTYANALQPIERIFDAFWFVVDFGAGALPDTRGVDQASLPMGILPRIPVQVRDDLGVPAFVFNTETEAPSLYPVRQPDTALFRLWEVAGTAHTGGVAAQQEVIGPLMTRDGITFALGAAGAAVPQNPNVLEYRPAHRAAFVHFNNWVRGGPPPPSQDRIDIADGDPPAIRRDEYGNALGGIRLPDFDVPTGVHTGTVPGDVLASLLGSSRMFTPSELAALYPNRNAYLTRWHSALERGVRAGFILPDDAPTMKAVADETAATIFPK